MNICLIGDNITSLTLAKNLVNKNIKVVVYHNRKNNFEYSFLITLKFFFNDEYVKGKRSKNTNVHLQKANEIGGTNSTPPLATIKLDAMNIG